MCVVRQRLQHLRAVDKGSDRGLDRGLDRVLDRGLDSGLDRGLNNATCARSSLDATNILSTAVPTTHGSSVVLSIVSTRSTAVVVGSRIAALNTCSSGWWHVCERERRESARATAPRIAALSTWVTKPASSSADVADADADADADAAVAAAAVTVTVAASSPLLVSAPPPKVKRTCMMATYIR